MAAADTLSVQVMPRRMPRSAGSGPPASHGCRPPPSGRSARTVRQLARFAQVRLESGASTRIWVGVHADRTAFTGRDLTQIVGRVEGDGLVGTSPDGLGAGLPYG
ncbi:fibronectin type III-like domain-contianing protein [Streptomyces sp. NPDC059455]|uniref:fibronectin type III-like domain-contianing protein n=1 Tax=Streptomyces sp. NPDC059455 TaxID=3346837 RepID=UPI00368B40DE